jgi:hypothetical protein
MRLTPAAARAATVNDLPLIPTMKLNGLTRRPAHCVDGFQIPQPRRH